MPAAKQSEPRKGEPNPNDAKDSPQVLAALGQQVLRALGQPANLHLVQVRRLWGNRFRANVFVGSDAASACVAHSYFLVTDGAGTITDATPRITKQY